MLGSILPNNQSYQAHSKEPGFHLSSPAEYFVLFLNTDTGFVVFVGGEEKNS